ncbi:resolvase, N-terminal domain protein [Pseudoflavonifractor capillosus ATCC 29799]|uniref:Resolvase, N-terminal domain protein n=1 Tax=Pseudoflavonifractor capillosus ATCC 29799 TaxID=411467 RepID=A6NUG8_9FIRM|nr:recombinase family protein [Pseudoflavonifractor capillosus]EDN00515.1 resolvase, N-terminal domain protein [Pseudoflavonifractor capillosus ATCC 29799]
MAANVKVIPPKAMAADTLRVAAYCRVSSDSSDQLHSYAAQIRYYTDMIQNHDGWELVDVYADEGITGTRMDKREDLNRLLSDCRKGKIDKVLVKSISRFARNTRDCLASLRELSRLGVSVQFEKENIDTGTLTTELMVSVSGSLAQQESVSISQNQRMSYQRRMERGEFITCKAPFGYRLIDGKRLEVISDEAKLVRWMFNAYLSGHSLEWIAEQMTKTGVSTTDGKPYWQCTTVLYTLTNEKYMGDSLCQKTFTTAFPFTQRQNHGEADQYYIENTHPAIITKGTFEKVQELLRQKSNRQKIPRQIYPLSRKVYCGQCGTPFARRVGKSGLVVWVCRKHDKGASKCTMGRIPESALYAAFAGMYNKLKQNVGIVLLPALKQMEELRDALQRDDPAMLAVNRAIAQASEQSHRISQLQAAGLLDADACAAKFNEINARLTQLRAERRRLLKNEDIDDAIDALQRTADLIQCGPERLEGFDEGLFHDLVERIVVESQTCVRFYLRGGLELTEQLREVRR